ncbi:hypothetical protein [Deinococcus sp.]|uniref:hypothetical protein n=1 Tax=Deinococcus sp. TaxID=47478 RepID=UPI003C7DA1C1
MYFSSGGGERGGTWDILAALVLSLLLTLGLFTLLVNEVLSTVASTTRRSVTGFGAAVVDALIPSVVSWALASALHLFGSQRQEA